MASNSMLKAVRSFSSSSAANQLIKNTLKTDRRFREFIKNPVIKRSLKMEAMKDVAAKTKLSVASTNLLSLLAENGRLKRFDSVSAAFSTIMSGHRGDLQCEVTTAKPLDAESKAELEKTLKLFAKKGENVILVLKVNPALIGGMVVSIGDKYVDMSVASKVKKYTELIQAAV
ncbi:ATP synthase subunit O, mitochondrial isoform X2 [Cimex lectularius]|uniref:Oligomycin sensitivity conferral protein n=1 Tax=Cimex lectularius TaxID=79782 RepID=A0A8I6RVL9_CIMLE|nr:ATP synthase subunit O, mitochondrial isoform X2 [Cimex lectularius]